MLVFGLVVLRNAWVAEDAYICLRTVDNWVNGHGLTWNPGERVQTFTCPLWVMLLGAAYSLTHEAFLTTLFLSLVVSLLAAGLIVFILSRSTGQAVVGVLILTLSKAGIDFATSGLENPLSHLLLVLFGGVYLLREPGFRTTVLLGLCAALAVVNRMDTLLLVLPALVQVFWAQRGWRTLGALALGAVPFLAWECFAVVYYGFPFPNTAYAKLGTGIPAGDLWRQGGYYLFYSFKTDPLTLCAIVAGVVVATLQHQGRSLALAVGVELYLLYVVQVGGDFMTGRFLTAPLIVAVVLLVRCDPGTQPLRWPVAATAAAVLGCLCVRPPLLTGFGPALSEVGVENGIIDEAACFQQTAGLLVGHFRTAPENRWAIEGQQARRDGVRLAVKGNVGYFGYYAGPDVEIVDPLALTDPLLARLPAVRNPRWRIGHFERKLPAGYLASLASGENRFRDANLGLFYEKLRLVTRGPLFGARRWAAIWNFNTGAYAPLIDQEHYRDGTPLQRELSELPRSMPTELTAFTFFDCSGVQIDAGRLSHAPALEISLGCNFRYEILYLKGEEIVGRQPLEPEPIPAWGRLQVFTVPTPAEARERGFSRVQVVPDLLGYGFALGHLRLEG